MTEERGRGMMVGQRYYSDSDMLRMQRDAEARVREMQDRARRTVESTNGSPAPSPAGNPRNRNWSSGPNTQRQQYRGRQFAGEDRPPPPPPEPEPEPAPAPPEPAPVPRKEGGTVIGDIMDALGLDSDYLLIVGLILILINQRADTTLILALAYLLI